MMKKQLTNRGQRLILALLALSLVFCMVMAITLVNVKTTLQETTSKPLAVKEITPADLDNVKGKTNELFSTFASTKTIPDKEQVFTDVTYKYFSRDFIENVFPKFGVKNSLFGIFGFDRFISTRIHLDDSGEAVRTMTGTIKNFEIYHVDKDNVNRTVTTYIRLDGLYDNETYWIEWRNVPGEGWKVNALSFVKTLDELKQPLSPKQKL